LAAIVGNRDGIIVAFVAVFEVKLLHTAGKIGGLARRREDGFQFDHAGLLVVKHFG
jgi:hypothetical protein